MKVAAYYRVSTAAQGSEDAMGLPQQRDAVERYCATEGHEIVATYEDRGYSGTTADRPHLAAMLAAEGFQAVVVARWDRLARDVRLDGYLRYSLSERGIDCLSATETNGIDPMSKMVQGILASVAGFDRDMIVQRLAGARKLKAERGGYAHGGARYGTRAIRGTGTLHTDENEQRTLCEMQRLRAAGMSYRKIADALTAQGYKPRFAATWNNVSVRSALLAAERAAVGAQSA